MNTTMTATDFGSDNSVKKTLGGIGDKSPQDGSYIAHDQVQSDDKTLGDSTAGLGSRSSGSSKSA